MNTLENNHVDDRHPDMPAMQSSDCILAGFDSMCSLWVRGVIQGGICDRHDFLQTNTSYFYQARYGYSKLQSFASADRMSTTYLPTLNHHIS